MARGSAVALPQVPLDAVDPSRQSLLYTVGDQAAVTPIYDYDFSILYGAAAQSSWREILWCPPPPGGSRARLGSPFERREAAMTFCGQLSTAWRPATPLAAVGFGLVFG